MRAGSLRHKVTIQKATESQDSYGEPDPTWGVYAVVWASIEPVTGREYLQNRQTGVEITHKVTIRYLDGVTAKMRVLYDGRYFDIEAVLNDKERNAMHILMCKELA